MIQITKFKKYQKNTLQGFFTLRMSNIGLEIRDCTLHEKGGKRWVGLPAKPYQDADGTQNWSRIIDFFDKTKGEQFETATLKALDKYKGTTDE